MELSPGLHRIECPIGPRYIAVYAIVGNKYTLLVDTGFDDSIRTTVVNYFKEKNKLLQNTSQINSDIKAQNKNPLSIINFNYV